MSKNWWAFDGPDFDGDELDTQIETHEKAAMAAIRAIADFGEANPDKGLVIGASLRKLSTVAGARAESLGLRSVKVKRQASTHSIK